MTATKAQRRIKAWGQNCPWDKAQELCESRGGRPGPISPYGLCGHKILPNLNALLRAQELCESRGGRPGLPVPNSPYDLRGRKATVNRTFSRQSSETV